MNRQPPIADADLPPVRSRADFAAAIVWAVQTAVARQARRLVCCADSLADWPLGDAGLLDTLTGWLREPQRRLVLLSRDFDAVRRHHPRFMAWRQDWSHAVEAWSPPAEMGELPILLLDDGAISVRLVNAVHWRGRVSADERVAHLYREQIDALLQRSEAAFPVHHLGL